ncbi:MAG: CBS domain-containing protein [Deltaproteobacteria bacterium]|nr:CBS domain-containing protein [Deltaproteobacteria bacterium]
MSEKVPKVANFMTRSPTTIEHSSTLSHAHEVMRKEQIRHLPVTDGSVVIGVVSVRDLHLIETFDGVDQDKVLVKEAMSAPVYHVHESDQVHLVAAKMAQDKVGSAVVLDEDDTVTGIFTVTDALIALLHAWKDKA